VLFRSSFHSYKLELELSSVHLEYEKRGGLKLTESAHIKDMIAFLRVLANPQDTLSWNRILLQLDRVGPATAQKISIAIVDATNPFQVLKTYPAAKIWKESLARLAALYDELLQAEPRPTLLYEIVRKYYQPIFERIYHDDYPKRQKDIDQLKSVMEGYEELQPFLDDTSLDPPDESGAATSIVDKLVLSTIHSSKGLEFEVVFVIGLSDGRFPHAATNMFSEQWEEERRLLYVAATRAKKNLFLTYPRNMMSADRQFRRAGMSPFLAELSAGVYEKVDEATSQATDYFGFRSEVAQPRLVRKPKVKKLDMADFSVGCKVSHPFFGNGTVTKLSKGRSLDINFDRHGMKTLHLDYAKLTIL